MNSLRSIIFILIIFLSASPAKSQWIPCQGIEGGRVSSITYQDSAIFCVGFGGIFKRQINAESWDTACLIYNVDKVRSTGNALFTYGGNIMSDLFRSLDNGITWEELSLTSEYYNMETVDSVIFIGNYEGSLFCSSDNGESWTDKHPASYLETISGLYSQPGVLFCQLRDIDTLFRSDYYGNSWITYPLNGITDAVCPHLFNGALWLAQGNNFFIYNEADQEWIMQIDSLPQGTSVSNFIEDGGSLGCYTNNGYFLYNDLNSKWLDQSQGLESRRIWDACKFDNTIYLATDSGPFSKSGSNPWMPQYNDLFVFNISKAFSIGNRIYALAKGEIFYSDEPGQNFEPMNSEGYCPGDVIITDSAWYSGSECGFAISSDSGQTWIYYNNGLEGHGVISISVGDQYYYAEITQPYGLARTRIDSIAWERVPNEFGNMYITDIEVMNNTLFAIVSPYDYSLFKSNDNGLSFVAIQETGDYLRRIFVKNDKVFILSEHDDVLFSDDSGITWNTWIYNSENLDFISIDMTDDENTTVLGGSDGPWNPINKIVLYSPDFYDGLDITDNLPPYLWTYVSEILIFNGGIFACPSSGGLWYRDDLAVGVNENETSNSSPSSQISIYPNPANDFINIHFEKNNERSEYQVVDYSGKTLMKGKVDQGLNHFSVDVSNLPNGIYLFVIRNEDKIISGKFIRAD